MWIGIVALAFLVISASMFLFSGGSNSNLKGSLNPGLSEQYATEYTYHYEVTEVGDLNSRVLTANEQTDLFRIRIKLKDGRPEIAAGKKYLGVPEHPTFRIKALRVHVTDPANPFNDGAPLQDPANNLQLVAQDLAPRGDESRGTTFENNIFTIPFANPISLNNASGEAEFVIKGTLLQGAGTEKTVRFWLNSSEDIVFDPDPNAPRPPADPVVSEITEAGLTSQYSTDRSGAYTVRLNAVADVPTGEGITRSYTTDTGVTATIAVDANPAGGSTIAGFGDFKPVSVISVWPQERTRLTRISVDAKAGLNDPLPSKNVELKVTHIMPDGRRLALKGHNSETVLQLNEANRASFFTDSVSEIFDPGDNKLEISFRLKDPALNLDGKHFGFDVPVNMLVFDPPPKNLPNRLGGPVLILSVDPLALSADRTGSPSVVAGLPGVTIFTDDLINTLSGGGSTGSGSSSGSGSTLDKNATKRLNAICSGYTSPFSCSANSLCSWKSNKCEAKPLASSSTGSLISGGSSSGSGAAAAGSSSGDPGGLVAVNEQPAVFHDVTRPQIQPTGILQPEAALIPIGFIQLDASQFTKLQTITIHQNPAAPSKVAGSDLSVQLFKQVNDGVPIELSEKRSLINDGKVTFTSASGLKPIPSLIYPNYGKVVIIVKASVGAATTTLGKNVSVGLLNAEDITFRLDRHFAQGVFPMMSPTFPVQTERQSVIGHYDEEEEAAPVDPEAGVQEISLSADQPPAREIDVSAAPTAVAAFTLSPAGVQAGNLSVTLKGGLANPIDPTKVSIILYRKTNGVEVALTELRQLRQDGLVVFSLNNGLLAGEAGLFNPANGAHQIIIKARVTEGALAGKEFALGFADPASLSFGENLAHPTGAFPLYGNTMRVAGTATVVQDPDLETPPPASTDTVDPIAVDLCLNLSGIQDVVPELMERNGNGECLLIQTVPTTINPGSLATDPGDTSTVTDIPSFTGLTCESTGQFTYDGPIREFIQPGMCISCPVATFIAQNGSCTVPAAVAATDPVQPVSTASADLSGRGSAPELSGSQLLRSAPERGDTGPGSVLYLIIAALVSGGMWIRGRHKRASH